MLTEPTVTTAELSELKAFKHPPELVKKVLNAVQILLKRPTGWDSVKKSIQKPKEYLAELKDVKGRIDKGEDFKKPLKELKKLV